VKFGGSSKLGLAQFGGDPYALEPGYVVDRIIASLERFKRSGSTGHVETLDRLTGPLEEAATWDRISQAGTPAMLVAYLGGPFAPKGANGLVFTQTVTFAIVCTASDFRGRTDRLEGRNIYYPGLDALTRWALFYTGRELQTHGKLRNPRPVRERILTFSASHFASVVEFQAETDIDFHDDAITDGKLEALGIVHNPSDLHKLFDDDNTTPNTDDPTGAGVAEL